jgi:hypothetical protein
MESWDKSDSKFCIDSSYFWKGDILVPEKPEIGPNDLKLMKSLCWGGSEHRKFLREIQIWATIYPSRSVWQELDTYKVSTVRNSCSTMHKLGYRDLTRDDFQDRDILPPVIDYLNELGAEYRETKDYNLVRKMKKHLPEGFIQRAGYHLNYETAFNMFLQRMNHRLADWKWLGLGVDLTGKTSICDWIYTLPYMKELLEDHIGAIKLKASEVETLAKMLKRSFLEPIDESERDLFNKITKGK